MIFFRSVFNLSALSTCQRAARLLKSIAESAPRYITSCVAGVCILPVLFNVHTNCWKTGQITGNSWLDFRGCSLQARVCCHSSSSVIQYFMCLTKVQKELGNNKVGRSKKKWKCIQQAPSSRRHGSWWLLPHSYGEDQKCEVGGADEVQSDRGSEEKQEEIAEAGTRWDTPDWKHVGDTEENFHSFLTEHPELGDILWWLLSGPAGLKPLGLLHKNNASSCWCKAVYSGRWTTNKTQMAFRITWSSISGSPAEWWQNEARRDSWTWFINSHL